MNSYEDIIHLEHPTSKKHPRMPMMKRAAQFLPFAALTGHDRAILESSRITEEKIELSEQKIALLNEKIQLLFLHLSEHPLVSITYFKNDAVKAGGEYSTLLTRIHKIDEINQNLVTENGEILPMNDLLDISGHLFDSYEE